MTLILAILRPWRPTEAALYRHGELVTWLCEEGGFAKDEYVMQSDSMGFP